MADQTSAQTAEFNPYPDATADQPKEVTPLKTVRYLREMSKVVPLRFPLECDGVTYDQIKVKSITIGAFRKHVEAGGDTFTTNLPMFEDIDGNPVPREVMDALAVGDSVAVRMAAEDFLSNPSPAEQATA